MKALAVLRVSTTSQQIDDQREELYAYINSMGYDEIVPVEAIGASAVKLDAKYMEMAEKIKTTILEGGIDAVCVWEISRLGRNEAILMDFKEFFIRHRVQFICKNPTLKLLNDDGSVNGGTELAFSLFATMAKQEAAENKVRFKRAKTAMLKKGQYIGGNIRKFGYLIDGKTYVENKEEADIVRLVFDLYSTGQHSTYTLAKELQERGYNITDRQICRILKSDAYCGEEVGEYGLHYPPIISKELFDKCAEIRKGNKIEMKRVDRVILGAKLVKCPVCGATCTSNSRHYVCSRHSHHGSCSNGFALRQCVADDLLWRIASTDHLQYLIDMNENKTDEYRKQLLSIEEKIKVAEDKIQETLKKKDRIIDSYLEGLIDKEKRDLRLLKVEDDVTVHRDAMSGLQDRKRAITRLLESEVDTYEAFEAALDTMDSESKSDIIHQHITSLTAVPESFGKRDPRTTKPNGVRIEITTVKGWKETFMYVPKYLDGSNLYHLVRGKWIKNYVIITDKKKKGD